MSSKLSELAWLFLTVFHTGLSSSFTSVLSWFLMCVTQISCFTKGITILKPWWIDNSISGSKYSQFLCFFESSCWANFQKNFLSVKKLIITGQSALFRVRIDQSYDSVWNVCDQYIPHRLNVLSTKSNTLNSLQQIYTIFCISYLHFSCDCYWLDQSSTRLLLIGFSRVLMLPAFPYAIITV